MQAGTDKKTEFITFGQNQIIAKTLLIICGSQLSLSIF
jgi:hypothetical protein